MKTSHFLTFVGGAIAGAAIALLFAPEKGVNTRHRIKEFIDEEVEKRCKCGGKDCACDEVAE